MNIIHPQLSQNRLSLGIHVKCTLIRISLNPPKTFSCRIFICNAKRNKSIWPSYHAKQKSFVKWEIKLFIHNMFVCFMTYLVSSCNEIDIGKELWNVTHKCTTHPKDLQVGRFLIKIYQCIVYHYVENYNYIAIVRKNYFFLKLSRRQADISWLLLSVRNSLSL